MPPHLVRAHHALDRAVDAAYDYQDATTDDARVAFLFRLYQRLTSLLPAERPKEARTHSCTDHTDPTPRQLT